MIQVTDRDLIGALHMCYWMPKQERGPILDEMVESVVMFYPDTNEVTIETPSGEEYEFILDSDTVKKVAIHKGEIDYGLTQYPGTSRWIKFVDDEGEKEDFAMYIGEGKWLTEAGYYVWFFNIQETFEVNIEIYVGETENRAE